MQEYAELQNLFIAMMSLRRAKNIITIRESDWSNSEMNDTDWFNSTNQDRMPI